MTLFLFFYQALVQINCLVIHDIYMNLEAVNFQHTQNIGI